MGVSNLREIVSHFQGEETVPGVQKQGRATSGAVRHMVLALVWTRLPFLRSESVF